MKDLKTLIGQTPIFLEIFDSKEMVASCFRVQLPESINILYAWYEDENYSGSAYVLYEQNGKLFEVSGGHCSCYGLEDQWEPEEVNLKELENRLIKGTFGHSGGFKETLKEFFGVTN